MRKLIWHARHKIPFTKIHKVSKSISTNKNLTKLPKQMHLWPKTSNAGDSNHISFSLNANVSGTVLYKSRILFEIFEQDIDTEKTNYLTITLPHFDLCSLNLSRTITNYFFLKIQMNWYGRGKAGSSNMTN